MTIEELLISLAKERPNGVSFDVTAMRLLKQKIPLEDSQVDDLKAEMFQIEDGRWFSRVMIANDETRLAFEEQASAWLAKHGYFSVDRLFECFGCVFRHISTTEDCAAFLRHLGFLVVLWGKGGYFCSQPSPDLEESLMATSKTVAERLEEAGGTWALHEIEEALPHLTVEALENIREQFLPEVHAAEVGGIPCWRNVEAIPLPENFAEKLTTVVNTLVDLKEKVSVTNLEFALNLCYRKRFREEYDLLDNGSFMRVCAKHYQGGSDVFPNAKKSRTRANDLSVPDKYVRGPNTRFCNLGVSIGTKLIFAKDSNITCIVKDSFNQVEYAGKAWSISSLASHLLNVSPANGFYHFICDGERLWARRLRLAREGKLIEVQADETEPLTTELKTKTEIIGSDGHPISLATWKLFKRAGTNPRVVEWARRIESGESAEQIAHESGHSVSTVNAYIARLHCYFAVCENAVVMQKDGANV